MELDVKTILIAIVIITICIVICLGGFKMMNEENSSDVSLQQNFSLVQNTANTIQKQPGTRIEKVETNTVSAQNTVEYSQSNPQTIEKLIEKNNSYPAGFSNVTYVRREIDYSRVGGKTLYYKIPESWGDRYVSDKDPDTGAYIDTEFSLLSSYGNYDDTTTYESFLNDFIEKERQKDSFPDYVQFRTRELTINEQNKFTIIEKVGNYAITNYIVLVQDDGVYYVSVTVSNDEDYNSDFLNKVDSIFSTVYVGVM